MFLQKQKFYKLAYQAFYHNFLLNSQINQTGMGGYSNTNYNAYPTQNSINPVGQYQAQRPLANNMIPMPSTSAGAVYTLPTPAVNPFNPFSYNFMQMNPFGANFPLGPNNPFASFTGFTG